MRIVIDEAMVAKARDMALGEADRQGFLEWNIGENCVRKMLEAALSPYLERRKGERRALEAISPEFRPHVDAAVHSANAETASDERSRYTKEGGWMHRRKGDPHYGLFGASIGPVVKSHRRASDCPAVDASTTKQDQNKADPWQCMRTTCYWRGTYCALACCNRRPDQNKAAEPEIPVCGLSDRPKSQIETCYERMVSIIQKHGGNPPKPDEVGSLEMMADFCWALDVVPEIKMVPLEK